MNATASPVERLLAMLDDPREDRVRIEGAYLQIKLKPSRWITVPCASGNIRAVLEVVCAKRAREIDHFLRFA